MAPFRITPPTGPGDGHWEGNLSNTRYDVFPSGSYEVGDLWYEVIEHEDLGSEQANCDVCGSYEGERLISTGTQPGWVCADFGFTCPGCPSGTTRVERLREGGYSRVNCYQSYTGCNTCWVSNWRTKYIIYSYAFLAWNVVGDTWRSGYFES